MGISHGGASLRGHMPQGLLGALSPLIKEKKTALPQLAMLLVGGALSLEGRSLPPSWGGEA